MTLTDAQIRQRMSEGRISFGTFGAGENAIQPCSVDLRLFGELIVPRRRKDVYPHTTLGEIARDHRKKIRPPVDIVSLRPDKPYYIMPGDFVLGCTLEYVSLDQNILGHLSGKSTWARDGLLIECAGLVDPGWEGRLTLEMKNLAPWPIAIYLGDYICQIELIELSGVVNDPYNRKRGAHYNGSAAPVVSLGGERSLPEIVPDRNKWGLYGNPGKVLTFSNRKKLPEDTTPVSPECLTPTLEGAGSLDHLHESYDPEQSNPHSTANPRQAPSEPDLGSTSPPASND